MHKKKVLFMINSMYGGGAEKIFQTLLNNLEPSKYDITVYSVNQCKIDHKYYPENIKYKYIFGGIDESTGQISKIITKIKNKINLSRYEKDSPETFYKKFIKEKYDVEVAFIEGYATKIISGSNNKDSKKIAWVHIDLMENPWTEVAYHSLEEEKECYQKYDNIFDNSIRLLFASIVTMLYSLILNNKLYFYLKRMKNNIFISNVFSTIIIQFIASILFGIIAYTFVKDTIDIIKLIMVRYLLSLVVGLIGTIPIYITKYIKEQ